MKSHHNPSSLSSLQQLFEKLETLIALESNGSGSPWVSVTRLSQLFRAKYGASLENVAKKQGYGNTLRSLFKGSKRFSIYGTPMPQEFYVALFETVTPVLHQPQTTSGIAIDGLVRTGCRGGTPGWGQSPHTPFDPSVLTFVATAINAKSSDLGKSIGVCRE